MKRNAALLWFLGLLACPSGALAAGFEYGPQGVHALGRGGAFTAGADDPSAIWWNPAALARIAIARARAFLSPQSSAVLQNRWTLRF